MKEAKNTRCSPKLFPTIPFFVSSLDAVPTRLTLACLKVALPSLAFGATAIGRSIPENADMFLEVTLVELGAEPIIDEEQEQWLRQNPL
jgi:hypothetical protein